MVIVIPYGEQDIDQSVSTEVKMKKVKTILMMGLIIMVLTISNNAFAGRRIYVKVAPPAPKKVVVVKPVKPWKNAVWISAHWTWDNGHWVWSDGHWQKAKSGHKWVAGHWKHTRHGWTWIEGRWTR